MPYVVAFLAALVVLLVALLYVQQRRHDRNVAMLFDAFRAERALLIDKVTAPERPMAAPRPAPKVEPRRSKEAQAEFARVGTVAPPRDPKPDEN